MFSPLPQLCIYQCRFQKPSLKKQAKKYYSLICCERKILFRRWKNTDLHESCGCLSINCQAVQCINHINLIIISKYMLLSSYFSLLYMLSYRLLHTSSIFLDLNCFKCIFLNPNFSSGNMFLYDSKFYSRWSLQSAPS